jgi:hypothetical protein
MRSRCWPFVFFAPTIVSCAAAVSASDVAADAETTTTSAIVVVERSADPAGTPSAQASARFVRVARTSSSDEALRAIGAKIDLPALGTCAPLASLADGVGPDDPAPFVELLDVGLVSLEPSAGPETRLVPRQLPDVTDIVSGVVYARATDPGLLPADSRYVLHVAGGPSLPAFDAIAVAPAAPSDVRVAGEDGASAIVVADESVRIAWSARPAGDSIYVDVQPAGMRCLLQADGRGGNDSQGTLPSSLFGGSGFFVIHRLHREALRAIGLDSGEIRFDFARSIGYRHR